MSVQSSRERGRAGSTPTPRRASTQAVLSALWGPDPVTGSDLMQSTGLTRVTVHDVCADLIAHGWVEELDDQRVHGGYARGRPARRYGLRSRAGVVVGLEAASDRCTAVVTDLLGRVVGRAAAPSPRTSGGRRVTAAAVLGAALQDAGATGEQLLSVTVALPAPVAPSGRVEVRSNPYWTLMDVGIADHLRAALPCPVLLGNDADLAALAEGRHGAATGVADHLTVLVDGAFGAGLVANGSLVRGRWGRGGEMRWLDLVPEVSTPAGLAPLLTHWAEGGTGAPRPVPVVGEPEWPVGTVGGPELTGQLARAQEVLAAAARGDRAGLVLVERAGRHVARVVATAAGMLDPEVVVLAGRLAPHLQPVLDVIAATMPDLLDEPVPAVVASRLGDDVVSLGAAQSALDDVRGRALDLRLPVGSAGGARRP